MKSTALNRGTHRGIGKLLALNGSVLEDQPREHPERVVIRRTVAQSVVIRRGAVKFGEQPILNAHADAGSGTEARRLSAERRRIELKDQSGAVRFERRIVCVKQRVGTAPRVQGQLFERFEVRNNVCGIVDARHPIEGHFCTRQNLLWPLQEGNESIFCPFEVSRLHRHRVHVAWKGCGLSSNNAK
jgi:hypothetical protein